MEIRSLEHVDIAVIIDCFLRSFEGYFVPLPTEMAYWQERFADSGVDYTLSFGVFDADQLVAFVIHCVGQEAGQKVAFNTGTGVLPAYRGQHLVDQMIQTARVKLKDAGIGVYRLEVIDQNIRAIRVYERVGLRIKRRLRCYQGPLAVDFDKQIKLVEVPLVSLIEDPGTRSPYAWDMSITSILRAGDRYQAYQAFRDEQPEALGSFIIDGEKAHLAQLEVVSGDWDGLFSGIGHLVQTIKINNIDAGRKDLLQWLDEAGISNVIDQFEMEMPL